MLPGLLVFLSVWIGPSGAALPFQSDDEVIAFLHDAKLVEVDGAKLGGISGARKILVANGGVRAHAVFRSFERVYRNTERDTGKRSAFVRDSYRNEIAAYELSRLLGLDTIPPTIPWRMGERAGSLQLWIENAKPGYNPKDGSRRPPDPERWQMERDTMRAFDALIENIDRNVGNMLVDSRGRVWWIDHTRSFGRQHKLEDASLITRCDRALYERLKAVDPRTIAERLAPYLPPLEIAALLERHVKLLKMIEDRIARDGESRVLFTRE